MDPATSMYHPLDGTELLKWVILDAGQKLAEYSEFSKARAYHNPKYTLQVRIETYDALCKFKDQDATFAIAGQKTPGDLPEGAQKVTLAPPNVENGPITTPDEARDQLREGRYSTKKVGEILCDVKEPKKWGEFGEKNPDAAKKEAEIAKTPPKR